MIKKLIYTACLSGIVLSASLSAHCQMPCGIYHDEMVFDLIDQYVETMVKGITVMKDNKFSTVQERNEFVRWVMQKDKSSDEISQMICTYFLQQKIKPGEEDTLKRLECAHRLLFLTVQIKQTVDLQCVGDFYSEWEKFKLMFHIEGYKCKVAQVKLKKSLGKLKEDGVDHSHNDHDEHDHDHDHDHDHHEHSH